MQLTPLLKEISSEPQSIEIEIEIPVKKKRGRPKKTDTPKTVVKKEEKKKSRRTTNTGGVSDDDNSMDLEDYATVVKLTVSVVWPLEPDIIAYYVRKIN